MKMDLIKANPTEFAAAYIQTLPHALKEEEFKSREEYIEYLDSRQRNYFHQFMRASIYANDEFQKYISDETEDV